ncbi:MAG: hypothetical protein J1F16_01390 [Muribaculaceae bacterium]|nr:hypothetical protein [Muribaculaceae bacterium]
MRKFYAIFSAMALCGAGAFAQSLGTPQITEPSGEYLTSVGQIVIQWMNDGEASTIELVNPDKDGAVKVDITLPETGNGTVSATLFQGQSGSAEGSENTGVGLIIDIPWGAKPFYVTDPYSGWDVLQSGVWKVSVPAGTVKAGSEMNTLYEDGFLVYASTSDEPETTPVILMAAEAAYVMAYSPADLRELQFSWDGKQVELIEGADVTITSCVLDNDGWAYYPSEEDGATTVLPLVPNDDNTVLSANLSQYAEGVYAIYFPENCAVLNGETIYKGGDTYYVKVFNGMAAGTLDYPDNTFSSFLSTLNFTWNYANISFVDDNNVNVIVTTPEGEEKQVAATLVKVQVEEGDGGPSNDPGDVPVVDSRAEDDETFNAISVNLSDLYEEEGYGRYYVKIPEGLVQNEDGLINPEQEFDFGIYPLAPSQAIVSPTEENNLIISYSGYEAIDGTYVNDAEIRNADNETISTPFLWFMQDEDNPSLMSATIYLFDYADGEYQLIIPEANLLLYTNDYANTYINREEVIFFTVENGKVSGIQGIEAAPVKAAAQGIYNLQGVKVSKDASSVSNLPAGIYIIDGKKVMIRK